MLTMYDDDENVLAALRAGAYGYTLKGAGPDELVAAVRAVARGEALFGAGIAARMLDVFGRSASATVPAADRARGRGARPAGPRCGQCGGRSSAWGQRQDGPQPRVQP